MLKDDPDSKAIQAALQGSQQAYYLLYDRYVDALFGFLHQFENERFQVSDWVQLSFIKAFQKLNQFQGRSSFKSWLFRIAINEMKQTKRSSRYDYESFDALEHEMMNEDQDFWPDWISLKQIIHELPERERLVLLMFEIEGFSHDEIGQMLDINPTTSRSILHRTKQGLRIKLNQ